MASTSINSPPFAADAVASFAADYDAAQIPKSVLDAAEVHVLDTLGCALAAAATGAVPGARRVVLDAGGMAESSVIGISQKVPRAAAALVNGAQIHGLDFDGTHGASRVHISATVVPAALACAEADGRSGAELLAAIVCGIEAGVALGRSAGLEMLQRGFHPTSWCGSVGAAVAAARLGELSAEQVRDAIGIAASLASGLMEPVVGSSSTKPIQVGWAAHAGVQAAALAGAGATGPRSALDGTHGFAAVTANVSPDRVREAVGNLGVEWETPRLAFKPYPACHIFHSHLDAVRTLCVEHGFGPADIARITARVPRAIATFVAEPVAEKRNPATGYDAKFSLQYSIAAMVVDGTVDLATYAEMSGKAAIRSVAGLVDYESADFETFPEYFPGSVRIELVNGEDVQLAIPYERGSDQNPMPLSEVREKFLDNARFAVSTACAERIACLLDALRSLDAAGVAELMRLLRRE